NRGQEFAVKLIAVKKNGRPASRAAVLTMPQPRAHRAVILSTFHLRVKSITGL
ncbi:hypothetical protein HMPREF9004_1120, partial [Schaalia cardiffensis F0333]